MWRALSNIGTSTVDNHDCWGRGVKYTVAFFYSVPHMDRCFPGKAWKNLEAEGKQSGNGVVGGYDTPSSEEQSPVGKKRRIDSCVPRR